MPSPGWTRAVIFLAAGLMFLLSLFTGDSINQDGLRWLGGVTSAVILAVLAFDLWLWRFPGIRKICELAGHPMIYGTWRGSLDYQRDGEGNPGQTEIYLAVRQTFSSVSVHCYFPKTKAESRSLVASLLRNDHRHDLRYIYQQHAPVPDRDRNRPTQGACELAVAGRPVTALIGSYYAERGGKGSIDAREYSRRVAGSLAEAEGLTFSLQAPRP
jgi:hypothetical protein